MNTERRDFAVMKFAIFLKITRAYCNFADFCRHYIGFSSFQCHCGRPITGFIGRPQISDTLFSSRLCVAHYLRLLCLLRQGGRGQLGQSIHVFRADARYFYPRADRIVQQMQYS